jgi:hypothetical protein
MKDLTAIGNSMGLATQKKTQQAASLSGELLIF